MNWLQLAVDALGDEENEMERWRKAVGFFEFSILREDVREKMANYRWWEFPEGADFVEDTLYDRYAIEFALNSIGKFFNITLDQWLDKPPFMCQRDIKVARRVNKIKVEQLDNAGGGWSGDLGDLLDV